MIAWHVLSGLALVLGLVAMYFGRRWIETATRSLERANEVLAKAVAERQATIALLRVAETVGTPQLSNKEWGELLFTAAFAGPTQDHSVQKLAKLVAQIRGRSPAPGEVE